MTDASHIPRTGIAVFILNSENKFIFGRRKGSHGQGTWALPGGHLELHESFEDCARREIQEETNLELANVRFMTAVNSPRIDGTKHYITIFMTAELADPEAQPQLLEPNKCEGWEWIDWQTMLSWCKNAQSGTGQSNENVLFLPMIDLVEQRPGLEPLQAK